MTLFQRLLGNVLSSYTGSVAVALIQLALVSFIVARVDLSVYGAALLVLSVYEILDLLRMGLGRATFKFLAEYVSGPWNDTLDRILASSFLIHITLGLLGLVVCWGLIPFLGTIFTIPPELADESSLALRVTGLVVCISFSLRPHVHLIIARERIDVSVATSVLGRVGMAGFTVAALLLWDRQILAIVFGSLAGDLVGQLLAVLMANRLFGRVRIRPFMASRQWLKKLIRFYLFDSLHPLSESIYRNLSLFLAAQIISLSAVAQLRVIFQVTRLIAMSVSGPGLVMVPTASRLFASGELDKVRHGVSQGTAAAAFMGGFTLVGVVPWVGWLLLVWVGAEFLPLVTLAILMLVGAFVRHSASVIHASLVGAGYVMWDGVGDLASTLVGMGVGLILALVAGPDLLYLGVGLFVCDCLRGLFLIFYGVRVFGLSLGQFLWHSYAKAVGLAAIFIAGITMLGIPAPNWFKLLLYGGSGAALYGLIGFFLVLPRDIRGRLWSAGRDVCHMAAKRRSGQDPPGDG